MTMKRFWCSFYFLGDDYRPIGWPPKDGILGYWNSGMRCADEATTLVIFVEAESEEKAKELIGSAECWPEVAQGVEWRFFEERDFEWRPSDRFPLKEWNLERINKTAPATK